MDRPNLTVLSQALVTRLTLEGKRVTGVECTDYECHGHDQHRRTHSSRFRVCRPADCEGSAHSLQRHRQFTQASDRVLNTEAAG